jgi:hypothetical protein
MLTHPIRFVLTLLTLLFLASPQLFAQQTTQKSDLIVKRDESMIPAVVTEVSDTEILYKRASNPTGPTYRIKISEIQSIRYANGETEQFNQPPAQPQYQQQPSRSSMRQAPAPRPEPRAEPEPRPQRYEPRPRYERPAREVYSGGGAFERGRPMFFGGIMLPSEITPFTAGVEFAASDDFGIGGRVWYWSKNGTSDFTIQAIANYHLARAFNAQNGKIDPYLGAAISKTFASYSGGDSESGDIAGNLQLGMRYLVNEKVGPYAQLNIGLFNRDQTFVFGNSSAVFELGVAVKLGR